MSDLPQCAVWNIRFTFILGCIATAALTAAICAEAAAEYWRLAMAGIGGVFVGLYCGLWLSVECEAER